MPSVTSSVSSDWSSRPPLLNFAIARFPCTIPHKTDPCTLDWLARLLGATLPPPGEPHEDPLCSFVASPRLLVQANVGAVLAELAVSNAHATPGSVHGARIVMVTESTRAAVGCG
ncbi:MAG: hypothetical protein FWD57_08320 [Polyangiaceae bacterium]|nr:hypothetical protein [Polyangiaceae bacterium]